MQVALGTYGFYQPELLQKFAYILLQSTLDVLVAEGGVVSSVCALQVHCKCLLKARTVFFFLRKGCQ